MWLMLPSPCVNLDNIYFDMKSYFPLIDILRFVAALSVVCFHYFSSHIVPANFLETYIKHGYMGVQLFFIISGFVIYFSLAKSIREYFIGRFLRLYPLFWVMCSVTYISTLILDKAEALSLKYFFLNLFIINTGQTSRMIDGSYWTLTMEIVFYFAIGVYVYLFSLKNVEWFYILWLALAYAVYYLGLDGLLITKLMLVRYAPYFVIGGLSALIYQTHKSVDIYANIRRFSALGLALLAPFYISQKLTESVAVTSNHFGIYSLENNIILIVIYMLVAAAIILNDKIINKSIILWAKIVGGITYPLYLLHQKFGSLIIIHLGGQDQYGRVSYLSLTVLMSIIVLCYFISKYEERWRKLVYKKII